MPRITNRIIDRISKKLVIGVWAILRGGLVLAATNPNLAQEDRFQKFGVTLDAPAEAQILFWRRVYSEYSSEDLLVHDPSNLSRVYAVVRGQKEAQKVRRELLLSRQEAPEPQGNTGGSSAVRIQAGLKDRLGDAFILARRYLKRMQEILEEEQVPKELALIPFVESAFNHEARSGAGAVGIWQFMPAAAIRDLRVTSEIDERYDPLKSTRAAARYLRKNREQLGSWALAVMAYHHGAGLVKKAVSRVGSRDPLVLIRNFRDPSFGFASRNYLFEFLAMCDFGLRQEEWMAPGTPDGLPGYITVSFPRKTRFRDVLQRYRLNENVTRVLNPHFREKILEGRAQIPAHYPIRMAGISLEEFRRLEYPQ